MTAAGRQSLNGESRAAVLDALRRSSRPAGVLELSEAVGLHPNTVRAHLDHLVRSGQVIRRSAEPRGRGRPPVVWQATGSHEEGRNYRLLAEMLVGELSASDRPRERSAAAGRRFAERGALTRGAVAVDGDSETDQRPSKADQRLAEADNRVDAGVDAGVVDAGVTALVRSLADAGFAPELAASGTRLNLYHCPFRELAEQAGDVVCSAHLGLLQGALHAEGSDVQATALLPFVEPGLCVATLEPRAR